MHGEKILSQKTRNIRISSQAWESLRWAKFKLQTKSYSETIIKMDNKIVKNRAQMLEKSLAEDFNEETHRVKVKVPKDEEGSIEKKIEAKTILLDSEAHRVLERIKIESNKPAYTFSDVIDFLVTQYKIKAK